MVSLEISTLHHGWVRQCLLASPLCRRLPCRTRRTAHAAIISRFVRFEGRVGSAVECPGRPGI
jgi:hypothetical protein